MGNKLTNFEQSIRSSFNDFEVGYDSQSWEDIEKRLDQQEKGSTNSSVFIGSLILVSSFLLIGAFYFMIRPDCEMTKLSEGNKGVLISRAIHGRSISSLSEVKDPIVTEENVESAEDSATRSTINIEGETKRNSDNNANSTAKSSEPAGVVSAANETSPEEERSESDLVRMEGNSKVAFKSSLTEACVGVEVTFELLSKEVEGSYLWNFGDGNFSNQPNPTHVFEKPGVYDISLSVRSLEDGVIRSNSVSKMIVVNPKPKANFDWNFINDDREITKVKFLNKSERAGEAEWHFHDGNISSEINPENDYKSKGEHLVKLIVGNEFGCIDSTYKYVDVKRDYNLNAPKTISISKGSGFMPEALNNLDASFRLTVYDNKQPIFETMSKDNPWKGTDLEGEKVTPGMSYPWVVIIYDEFNNEKEIFSGTITINP